MSGGVRLAVEGARATITLDRPDKLNALTVQDLSDFAAALGRVHAAEGARVLVVTGAGERAFSSGASLAEVDGGDWSDSPLTALCDGLEQFPLPTICALNGSAWGGAVEVALACDFRIGVEGMIARITPAALGICYDPGGVARI
ncbi:MAG: enoyl-CoA hydratase/isomerase family protein, partial [Rubrimonas sp.]